jgi:hypothetical protein
MKFEARIGGGASSIRFSGKPGVAVPNLAAFVPVDRRVLPHPRPMTVRIAGVEGTIDQADHSPSAPATRISSQSQVERADGVGV